MTEGIAETSLHLSKKQKKIARTYQIMLDAVVYSEMQTPEKMFVYELKMHSSYVTITIGYHCKWKTR